MYMIMDETTIRRLSDNACIPMDAGNRDYQEYLKWKHDGGTAEVYDPEAGI